MYYFLSSSKCKSRHWIPTETLPAMMKEETGEVRLWGLSQACRLTWGTVLSQSVSLLDCSLIAPKCTTLQLLLSNCMLFTRNTSPFKEIIVNFNFNFFSSFALSWRNHNNAGLKTCSYGNFVMDFERLMTIWIAEFQEVELWNFTQMLISLFANKNIIKDISNTSM